jgi:3-oxoacyl-[acyl-carrier-protein] synthase III
MLPVYLCGVSGYLPGEPIENSRLTELFNIDAEWIDLYVGTETRYLAYDFTRWQATETLASLGTQAAELALKSAHIESGQLDFIVLATATPDQLMPATVNQIADALGLNGIATFQIQCGCVGALQAMHLGTLLVRSGAYKKGLVIGADICTKFIRSREACMSLSASELINYALFGDGAGAVIVSNTPLENACKVLDSRVRFEGLGRAPGQEVNWFGVPEPASPDSTSFALREDYKAIQAHVPGMTGEMLDELLTALDWTAQEVDYFLLPQLSKNMSGHIREQLRLPEHKSIQCVDSTGNNGNALPFIQMAHLACKILPGNRALVIAIESSKWLKGGLALERC